MEVRERRCRKTSPERGGVCVQQRVIRPTFRKVQVVYYLSRNGQLEHPHIMEVTHLAHQHLRLRDATDRLNVLRGKGMPCLYSWSCKRSYKNGYVWYDLADNDIIYPSEGAEYILKGSELIEGSTEKFQQIECSNRVLQTPEQSFHPKRNTVALKRRSEPGGVDNNNYKDDNGEEEEPDEEDEEKTSYTSSNTSQSRCSRGVSTDEIEFQHRTSKPAATELTRDNTTSPPSTESSSTASDPPPTEQVPNRLLQLIACGSGSVSFRGKNVAAANQEAAAAGRKSSSTMHKEVLRRTAATAEEESEISCMSENPRFGNLQSEEKEYFSGSIIESAMAKPPQLQPSLKKSSSYNEERGSKAGLGEAAEEEELRRDKSTKSKCIPRKKPSSRQPTK